MRKTRASVAAVVSLVLVIAACGDDDEEAIPPATTAVATTAALDPGTGSATTAAIATSTTAPQPTTTTTAPTTTTTEPQGVITIEVSVVDGEIEGPDTVDVDLGSEVLIVVTSDVEDEVHLHGYNVIANVGPSSAAVIQFVAEIPGVFEMELEDAGELLLEVKVS